MAFCNYGNVCNYCCSKIVCCMSFIMCILGIACAGFGAMQLGYIGTPDVVKDA